jgi:hypothetical protein
MISPGEDYHMLGVGYAYHWVGCGTQGDWSMPGSEKQKANIKTEP